MKKYVGIFVQIRLKRKTNFLSILAAALFIIVCLIIHNHYYRNYRDFFTYCYHLDGRVNLKHATSLSEKPWFEFSLTDNATERSLSVHRFIWDNRPGKNALVSFVVVSGKLTTIKYLYVTLWYSTGNPVSVLCSITDIQLSRYYVAKVLQNSYNINCPLPYDAPPSYVSITHYACSMESVDKNQYIPVVFPDQLEPGIQSNQNIAVCLAPFYGNSDDYEAAFFIQWMESLLMFGVNKIFAYDNILHKRDKLFNDVLRYYIKKGYLVMEEFKMPYSESDILENPVNAFEAIRSVAVNYCFYKHYINYWYILHIDRDEIPVPKRNKTYQQILTEQLSNYTWYDLYKGLQPSKMASLAMPSAFVYRNESTANQSVSPYFPVLRHTLRQPTEYYDHILVGIGKSFDKPSLCNHLWSHRCFKLGKEKFKFLPEAEIIVHHYRKVCPVDHVNRFQFPSHTCATEENRRFQETYFVKQYGDILVNKTIDVFKAIGFNYLGKN